LTTASRGIAPVADAADQKNNSRGNMPKRFRLTRRFPVAMTEDGYRKLKRFSTDAGLDEGEALSFLFENFSSIIDEENLEHRLRLFNSEVDRRKR
jgi:hypothetical protein